MTSTPTAWIFTLSTKARTTSSATSASSKARRTSRSAASTSASVSAPRRVRRSRMPPSLSESESNIVPLSYALVLRDAPSRAPRDEGLPNTYGARGRIALSGGGLRPPGPVGGLHFGSWRERAEPMDAAARSQERRGDDEPHSKALLIPVPRFGGGELQRESRA